MNKSGEIVLSGAVVTGEVNNDDEIILPGAFLNEDEIIPLTPGIFVEEKPIRSDITIVLPAAPLKKLRIGWVIFEDFDINAVSTVDNDTYEETIRKLGEYMRNHVR